MEIEKRIAAVFIVSGLCVIAPAAAQQLQQIQPPREYQGPTPQIDEQLREQIEDRQRNQPLPPLTRTGAKYLHRLTFQDERVEAGTFPTGIEFTLFNDGETGPDLRCRNADSPTLFLTPPCGADNSCQAKTSRMASMLLSAKLAGKPVSIAHSDCYVYEVSME